MPTKTYFAKVSWNKNEIVRRHENITFDTDLTKDKWDIVFDAKVARGRAHEPDEDFTIDFMIEVPEGD